jgi:acetyl esterase/lipase
MVLPKLTRREWWRLVGLGGALSLGSGCGRDSPLKEAPEPEGPRRSYGSDPFQFGDLRLPAGSGPHPVAVVIHGGFWRFQFDLQHIARLAMALTAAGWATWNIEYRRLGNPGGGWPGTFQDVAAAADYLRQLAVDNALDLDRVLAVGHSAGGHLALWLAARSRIPKDSPLHASQPLPLRAVVALAGVADLRRAWELALSNKVVESLLGGSPAEVPERYASGSPVELLPLGVRQVLIHGTKDNIVPFEISQTYHRTAMAQGDEATLIPLDGAGHFEVVAPETAEGRKVSEALSALK